MSRDNIHETCGKNQHEWVYNTLDEKRGVHCGWCDAVAIISGMKADGEGTIIVETHTHQLDDALKAAREAPTPQDIVWDNLDADIKEMNAAIRSAVKVGDKAAIGIAMEEATPPKICALCGKEYNRQSINSVLYCNCHNTDQVLIVEWIDEENGTEYQEYQE
jgi:hypothetical protein